jgi:hypothetical protein
MAYYSVPWDPTKQVKSRIGFSSVDRIESWYRDISGSAVGIWGIYWPCGGQSFDFYNVEARLTVLIRSL